MEDFLNLVCDPPFHRIVPKEENDARLRVLIRRIREIQSKGWVYGEFALGNADDSKWNKWKEHVQPHESKFVPYEVPEKDYKHLWELICDRAVYKLNNVINGIGDWQYSSDIKQLIERQFSGIILERVIEKYIGHQSGR